ncbi:MAG: hypothetical protein ACE5EL_01800 [Anaerolineae bacterium]
MLRTAPGGGQGPAGVYTVPQGGAATRACNKGRFDEMTTGPQFPLGTVPDGTYLEAITAAWGHLGIWDYLAYDEAGDLWIGGLRVLDAVERYGSPLEIVDTTLVERRAQEWMALTRSVADAAGYPGHLEYLYAGKANMASEIVHAALRSGWGAETSSGQELGNLAWMRRHGLLPPGLRIVCNGFKLPPLAYGQPSRAPSAAASTIALPPGGADDRTHDVAYAERIVALARDGWDITPILDSGELEYFARPETPPMSVGLRLKFGPVEDETALARLVSRFGMTLPELEATATALDTVAHLEWTTLHAMVGAAHTFPVERIVASLGFAGRLWARLRRRHPTLRELNIGGGVPPLGEAWDHRLFLRGLYAALAAASRAEGVPPPDVTFELGSLVAEEAGFHVFKIIQVKDNHDDPGAADDWAIVDGGLMAAIPDMLILGKPFRFLAAGGAHGPARPARVGDLTCDSDGRYPPRALGDDAAVLLPGGHGMQHLVIQGVGAYQEILAGVRGAHHCGLLEALELILERRGDGVVHGRIMPRQTLADAAQLLGYTDEARAALAATGATSRPGALG